MNRTACGRRNAGTARRTWRTTELTMSPFAPPNWSPAPVTMIVFERRAIDRLFERAGEVLQNDNRLRARIDELMLELTRRVERVAIDDHVARAQRAEGGDRILQHVRHHERDTGASRQARNILQVAREGARLQVQFAIGHRLAHADEGDPIAKLFEAGLDEIAERALRARVNLGRHALGIGLQPYPFHEAPVATAPAPSGASGEYRTGHAVVDDAMPVSAQKRAPMLGERRRPVRSQAQDTRRASQQRFLRVADHEFPGRRIHGIQQVVDEFVLNLEAQSRAERRSSTPGRARHPGTHPLRP